MSNLGCSAVQAREQKIHDKYSRTAAALDVADDPQGPRILSTALVACTVRRGVSPLNTHTWAALRAPVRTDTR